jgi:hypothetical protein
MQLEGWNVEATRESMMRRKPMAAKSGPYLTLGNRVAGK